MRAQGQIFSFNMVSGAENGAVDFMLYQVTVVFKFIGINGCGFG